MDPSRSLEAADGVGACTIWMLRQVLYKRTRKFVQGRLIDVLLLISVVLAQYSDLYFF